MVYMLCRQKSDSSFDKIDLLASQCDGSSSVLPRTKQEGAERPRRRRRRRTSDNDGTSSGGCIGSGIGTDRPRQESQQVERGAVLHEEEQAPIKNGGELPLFRIREDGHHEQRSPLPAAATSTMRRRRSSACSVDSLDDLLDHAEISSNDEDPGSSSTLSSSSSSSVTCTPSLPLTRSDLPKVSPSPSSSSPAPKQSPQLKMFSGLYYLTLLLLCGLMLSYQSRASSLSTIVSTTRSTALSAQHYLAAATVELRSYDDDLSTLESHHTKLRNELNGLSSDLVHRENELSITDREVLGEHEEFLRKMKAAERKREEVLDGLATKIRSSSRAAVLDKYGEGGRYWVKVTVDLDSSSQPSNEKKSSATATATAAPSFFVIETASLDQSPHSVHHFLEQVDANLWDGLGFTTNPGHLLRATPTTAAAESAFARAGLDRLLINESSTSSSQPRGKADDRNSSDDPSPTTTLRHDPYTIAFPTGRSALSPRVPTATVTKSASNEIGFYINTADNNDVHESDPIIGRVVEGRDVIRQMMTVPAVDGSEGGLLPGDGIRIVSAEIVVG
mmetsp:Transcript_36325/g.79072  ORF Transcript_36325/g.79072 Transcript_36325/m.79072 type:complete len:560 (-) Transcript_36325:130-1809(-)